MKLTDFESLELAHAHPVISEKVFNSNEMTMYLIRCELLSYVLDMPNELLRGFALRVSSDSRFDFRENSDDGIANIASINYVISILNDDSLITKFEALRDYLVADASKVVYPFAKATQEDWDKAQLELNPTMNIECSYPSNNYISKQKINVIVTIAEPLQFDDLITFMCDSSTDSDDDSYARNTKQRAAIAVPANFTGELHTDLNITNLQKRIKVFASSQFQRNFTASAIVDGA